jgi:tetratricopeptide (TPR) repeat protein
VLEAGLALWDALPPVYEQRQADYLYDFALVIEDQGKHHEAEDVYRETLRIYERSSGGDHPGVIRSLSRLGAVLLAQGKLPETEAVVLQLQEVRQRLHLKDPRRKDGSTDALHRDDESAAASAWAPQIKGSEQAPVDHWLLSVARVLREIGRFEAARTAFLEAAAFGDPIAMDKAAWFLATCADESVRDAKGAVGLAERAVAATERRNPLVLDTLAAAYAGVGRFAEAAGVQREALSLLPEGKLKWEYGARLKLFESGAPYIEYERLGNLLQQQGKPADAEAMFARELAMRRIMFDHETPEIAQTLHDLCRILQAQDKPAQAEPLARELLRIQESLMPEDWRTWETRCLIGWALLRQELHKEAELFLRSGYKGLKQREDDIPDHQKSRLKETLHYLIQLYEKTQRFDQAAEWKQILPALEEH